MMFLLRFWSSKKDSIESRAVDPDPEGKNLRGKKEKMQGKW